MTHIKVGLFLLPEETSLPYPAARLITFVLRHLRYAHHVYTGDTHDNRLSSKGTLEFVPV